MEFTVIAAVDEEYGIGIVDAAHPAGYIPWNEPADRQFFADVTRKTTDTSKRNAIIMGRRTWESLPKRPLPGRLNIVITSRGDTILTNEVLFSIDGGESVLAVDTLDAALKACTNAKDIEKAYVIGGAGVYAEAVRHALCRDIILTRIKGKHGCNVKFPSYYAATGYEMKRGSLTHVFSKHVNSEEQAYLDLLSKLTKRPLRPNRTGINTRGCFMETLRFKLVDPWGMRALPMMTTKTVPFRLVAEELLWFISGASTVEYLKSRDIHIWDGNTSRAFLDSRGLTLYAEGELGPGYGWQWRHFGEKYVPIADRAADYSPGGVDQLTSVINGIRKEPFGRRHVVSAWNPVDLDATALPPCHIMYEFYVDAGSDGTARYLSCHMHMRSADMFLGVPFNITSYSLLTHMVARVTGLQAKEFVITMADCHLYENHLEAASTQISRTPRRFPTLEFIGETPTIDDFKIDSFKVRGYHPYGRIAAEMAV